MDARVSTMDIDPRTTRESFAARFGLALDEGEAERIAGAIRGYLGQIRDVPEATVAEVEPAIDFRAADADAEQAP